MKEYINPAVTLGVAAFQYGLDRFKYQKYRDSDSDFVVTDPMDRVVAGDSSVRQRTTQKRKLKSGRVGRKLAKLNDSYVFRWQRIFNYGQNTTAYPPGVTQSQNLLGTGDPIIGGRLQLSHYSFGNPDTGAQANMLPVYLWDLTCWRTENFGNDVCRRLWFDSNGLPGWNVVYGQAQSHALVNDQWQSEKSDQSGRDFPAGDQQAAMLKWCDMRMCFYGARKHPTRIILELIQFNDEMFSMDYHPDGLPVSSMTAADQHDVTAFWVEETKKLVYHPLDVQQFNRNRAITSLYRESFQIAPDSSENLDVCPPNVVKKIFKRFNRLVKWNWNKPDPDVDPNSGELELPTYNKETVAQLEAIAHPRARIYLYIRAEDVDPVGSNDPLYTPAVVTPDLSMTPMENPNNEQSLYYYDAGLAKWQYYENGVKSDNPSVPPNSYVCGYDWSGGCCGDYLRHHLMPRFCKVPDTPEAWSTTTTPSFDIIIRNSWVLQN